MYVVNVTHKSIGLKPIVKSQYQFEELWKADLCRRTEIKGGGKAVIFEVNKGTVRRVYPSGFCF